MRLLRRGLEAMHGFSAHADYPERSPHPRLRSEHTRRVRWRRVYPVRRLRSPSFRALCSSACRSFQIAAHSVISSEETRSRSSATVYPSFSASSK